MSAANMPDMHFVVSSETTILPILRFGRLLLLLVHYLLLLCNIQHLFIVILVIFMFCLTFHHLPSLFIGRYAQLVKLVTLNSLVREATFRSSSRTVASTSLARFSIFSMPSTYSEVGVQFRRKYMSS
jgi:hypothetical protein